ncbi:MAG TPA: sulfatase-like hydrolase/transferase [Croceibacterium sp.]
MPMLVQRAGLRDVVVAVLVSGLVACAWLLVSEGGLGDLGPVRRYYVYILAYGYLILLLPPPFAGKRMASAISISLGLLVSAFLAADLTALRFFDTPFLKLYPYLPVTAGNASLADVVGYAVSYVPLGVWLLAVATTFLGMGASRLLPDPTRARVVSVLLLPLFYAGTALAAVASEQADPRIAALMAEPAPPLKRLASADRSGNFTLAGNSRTEPRTIVLVIMESTGASTPSSDGQRLLSRQIVDQSGTGRWVAFRNAVTNSNATDISVPSLLTGSGANESIGKIHRLPFVSQYAATRGYRTAFITSSTMRWAGFEPFFADASMDRIVTAADSGLPFINDLAVDDHFAYQAAAKAVEEADGKLFLTLYPQSLHWPFQTDSAFGIPAQIQDRRARATWIAETGLRLLFETLRKTGRLDDALIVVAGDHGEFDYASTLRMPRMRMDTFEDGILSPIFLVKAPSGMSAADYAALAANSDKLVANLDIAPTFADMLGAKLAGGLSFAGYSLLDAIPDDRIAYATSTNEWRHWTKAAIAVARGRERMTCNNADLCRLNTADGARLTFTRKAGPQDELFRLASSDPVLRQALGQIYRGHYQ